MASTAAMLTESPKPLTALATARAALDVVETHLATRDFLLGCEFSAADIMLGFTLVAAQFLGVLDTRYPVTRPYLARITGCPEFQRATAD